MTSLSYFPYSLLVAFFLLLTSSAEAHRPPPEALSACRGLSSGSDCEINTPRGRLDGSCRVPPGQSDLACVPDRRGGEQRPGGDDRPPQAGGGGGRSHTITQSDGLDDTVPANQNPPAANQITIKVQGQYRVIEANGIPDHLIGRFPNSGNPNEVEPQSYRYRVPAYPQPANVRTPLGMNNFGVAVNGVPFDPGAAEWYRGERGSQWQYEALSGAVSLGIDDNIAHVQPTGAYHYHGIPELLAEDQGLNEEKHSPLIGWAADGYPIYALYGYKDGVDAQSEIAEMTSSYQLKEGRRPQYGSNPGGEYDGTFVADYQYVPFSGTLDECNGRQTVTPDFPGGTYAYFLTEDWPVIPRCFRGQPSEDFMKGRP